MTALHHEVLGPPDAPVLLMGGSLGTTLEMWNGQLPLTADLRVVRFDHRGHGRSPVPPGPYDIADLGADVLELMDGLGLERASYCGLSIGGMVGMWLAAHAPDRVDHLVLLCTSAYMPPASMWRERAETVLKAGSVGAVADGVLERWLTPEFAARHPDVRAGLRSTVAGTSPQGYASCCGAIERMDLRGDLPAIATPTLVVSGSDDPSTPEEHQRVIAESIRGARHETVGPAAHLAAIEQPEVVNRLILEHVT